MPTKTRKGTGTKKKASTRTTTSVKPGGSTVAATSCVHVVHGVHGEADRRQGAGEGAGSDRHRADDVDQLGPGTRPVAPAEGQAGSRRGPGGAAAPVPLVGGTPEQIRARDQLLDTAAAGAGSGFAARFARAVRRIGEGVTIGIDPKLNVVVTQKATITAASASEKGHPTGAARTADRLSDARMRDLDETVSEFMREMDKQGLAGPARARFAAAVLGVVAKDGTKVEAVADAAIDGLRDRLNGKGWSPALPKDVTTLLTAAAKAWRATSEADFWTDLAAVAQHADGASDDALLHEQAAWMGLVAVLSDADLTPPPKADENDPTLPPWTWNTAAEKADLVDTLVTAAAGTDNPAQAVLRRLGTLTRGTDPLPRAIAAELAQLAFAALAGVKAAPALDRQDILSLKERAPDPNATQQELTEYQTREALRGIGKDLAARSGLRDPLRTSLFRNKLSTMYADMKQMLREYQPADATNEDDLPGEERLRRLMDLVGTVDGAVVDGLDAWSATIASGSTDPADYLAKARVAKAALDRVLQVIKDTPDPTNSTRKLYGLTSPETSLVGSAIEMLSAELGLEAGEVLLGQLEPPAEPTAGLRQRLQAIRGREILTTRIRQDRDAGKQKTVPVARTLATLKPKPAWVDRLVAAATAFDGENNKKPRIPSCWPRRPRRWSAPGPRRVRPVRG